MKRWEKSITVSAPIDNVFAYVSDFSRHGEWSGNELQISREDGGPVGVGSTFSTVAKQFGTQREKSTVTQMTPPREFGWDSTGWLGPADNPICPARGVDFGPLAAVEEEGWAGASAGRTRWAQSLIAHPDRALLAVSAARR